MTPEGDKVSCVTDKSVSNSFSAWKTTSPVRCSTDTGSQTSAFPFASGTDSITSKIRPSSTLTVWIQNDEHHYVQEALSRVYSTHKSHSVPLRRQTQAALDYQLSDYADLSWIVCPTIKYRTRPLISYLSSVLQATVAKNQNSSRHHNLVIDLTHVGADTKLESEEDLDPQWHSLLGPNRLHFANVRLCSLGLTHPQSNRPLKGSVQFLYLPGKGDSPLPNLSVCRCEQPRTNHTRPPKTYSSEGTRVREDTASHILWLLDGRHSRRKDHLSEEHVEDHPSPKFRKLLRRFSRETPKSLSKTTGSQTQSMQASTAHTDAKEEISPEGASELDLFPTMARMRQKAREKQIAEETGKV